MNKMTNRILSMVLVVVMLFGAIPGITLPATSVNAESTVVTEASTGKVYDFESDTVGEMPADFTAGILFFLWKNYTIWLMCC